MIRFFTFAHPLPLALGMAAAASGAQPDASPAIALPDQNELAAFASENLWDWGARLARFARRGDLPTEMVRLDKAECTYLSGLWPDCDVTLTVRFADGTLVTDTLSATFERDAAGRLEEVIILFHPRREPPIDTQPADTPRVN